MKIKSKISKKISALLLAMTLTLGLIMLVKNYGRCIVIIAKCW